MKTRIRSLIGCLVLLSLFAFPGCRKADAVEESAEDREAIAWLTGYLKIDTSNPPGRETAAAQYLQSIFTREGIECRLLGTDPARQSVYARLRSGSNEPALLLLHHLDVVPANAADWTVPPFAARRAGGYIWGRGALDIKSLGVADLSAMVRLKRTARRLRRDVIFLGAADEEAGGVRGTAEVLKEHPELFSDVGYVLGEGGANETIVDRVSFWGIEVAQKVPLWIRLTARGDAGHGAVPTPDGGAAARLVEALSAVQRIPSPLRVIPAVRRHFRLLAAAKKGIKREILLNPDPYLSGPGLDNLSPSYRALLSDTRAITEIHAGDSLNSIPGTAWAALDVRALPDRPPQQALEEIRRAVGSLADVEVVLQGELVPDSPLDTDLYRLLESVMKESEPGSVVGPTVSPGTSDSRYFRARNITSYGVSPFKVNYYDGSTIHGNDERIRARFFLQGVKVMGDIVDRFCSRPR